MIADFCVGCGGRIFKPHYEHDSGQWCPGRGSCRITDFEGVNRLRDLLFELKANTSRKDEA